MEKLFCAQVCSYCSNCNAAAAFFNEDIGAWDTSGATTMYMMFYEASSFNQDISDWAVDSVTAMWEIFTGASAFDQDLGWCVDYGVSLTGAFDGTRCESTSCGVKQVNEVDRSKGDCDIPHTGNVMVNWKIKQAVAAWLSDAETADRTDGVLSRRHPVRKRRVLQL